MQGESGEAGSSLATGFLSEGSALWQSISRGRASPAAEHLPLQTTAWAMWDGDNARLLRGGCQVMGPQGLGWKEPLRG